MRDPTFDVLLDLDGQVLVVDPNGGYWVRFIVTRVAPSPEKPHGIDYSLTLHGPDGERLVRFDNALLKQTSPPAPGTIARFIHQGARKRMRIHPVATQKRGEPQDHGHGCGRPEPTTTVTPQRLSPTSGARWTGCCVREE